MIYQKFEKDDILHNTIIVNPKVKIFIKDQKTYFKDTNPTLENTDYANLNGLTPTPLFIYLNTIRSQNFFFSFKSGLDFSFPNNSGYIAAI